MTMQCGGGWSTAKQTRALLCVNVCMILYSASQLSYYLCSPCGWAVQSQRAQHVYTERDGERSSAVLSNTDHLLSEFQVAEQLLSFNFFSYCYSLFLTLVSLQTEYRI